MIYSIMIKLIKLHVFQSIKKIKRADRKGSESVTEEKFALLFSAEITITGCGTPYKIQVYSSLMTYISSMVAVIVVALVISNSCL